MPRPVAPFNPFGYDEFQAEQQRQARARRAADDPVAQSIAGLRQSEVQRDLIMAGDADKTAQTNVLARRVGEPSAMIAGREGSVQRYSNIAGFSSVLEKNPGMTAFYLTHPGYLAAAQDDAKPQGMVAGAWDWISKIPGSLKAGWYGLEGQGARINWALATDVVGPAWDFLSSIGAPNTLTNADLQKRKADREAYWGRGINNADTKRDVARPQYSGPVQEGVLGGLESVPLMIGATATGFVTKSTGAALWMMGGTVGGSSYTDARLAGRDVPTSLRYGYIQGATEALTELAPESRLLGALAARSGVFKTVSKYLAAELPGEMTATLIQSYSEFLTLHPEQTVGDWVSALPRAEAMTVLGVLGGGAVHAGAMRGTIAIADKVIAMREARANGMGIEQLGEAALNSKLRQRDPEAYNELLKHLAEGAGKGQAFVSAEILASYMQSDSYDPFNDPIERYRDDVEEAMATGGDVALPAEFALGTLPGTPAWSALKDEMRLSAGGMSVNEADAFNAEMADLIQQRAEDADHAEQQRVASMEPVTKVYNAVFSQAREAGNNVRTASAYAELWSARYEARASRNPSLGNAWEAYQASNVSIQQMMPEAVAAYAKADNLDVLIHAMKNNETRESLLEWIARRGGVDDRGGDIASMDADKWHKLAKPVEGVTKKGRRYKATTMPGRRKLIRRTAAQIANDEAQGAMIGGGRGYNENSLEATFDAAISAGFFPDLYAQRENGSTYSDAIDVNDFLSAIGGELRGSPIYAEDLGNNPEQERMNQAVDQLREILAEHGVDPDKATKAQVAEALKAFADEQADADRSYNQGERGRIDIFADGRKIIRLFESRDLSTLLHEGGHLWLEEFHADAMSADAPDGLRGDFEAVKAWFAANGHAIGEDGSIPAEAHELFARSMERYFLEGKAPSVALRSTFETFRSWLLRLYLTVRDALVDPKSGALYGTAPLTPEIREVFDRMLATDEAISEAQAILRDMPMSQEDLGMTAGEYEAYQKSVGALRDDAFDALLYRTMETVRRARTVEWKNQRENVRREVAADLAERPEFKALEAIKAGTKLSRSGVAATLGNDGVSLLARGAVSDTGVHPSILAESVGLESGEELLLRLAGIKQHEDVLRAKGDKRSAFDEAADLEADALMRERHGDVLSDGSIEEEALSAIHSDTRSTVIASELNALARRSGNVSTPLKMAREWAERSVREGRISEHATGAALARHRRNELKAARAVEKAILAGDIDEAFNQKQAQLLNHERWRAAKTAKDEIDKIVRRLGKLAKAKTLKSMDQDYLDRIHDLLADYDFRHRAQRDIDERESFTDWVKSREAIGEEVHVPARLESAKATNWSQMAYGDLAALDDTVASIAHLGRRKKQFIIDGKKRDWREVRHTWLESAEGLAERKRTDDRNQPRSRGRELFSSVVRVDMMAKQMDNGDANGLMTQTFAHGASAADSVFARIHKSVLEPIINAYMEMGSGRLFEKISVPELAQVDPVTGDIKPGVFTRGDLLAVALNLGNESNLAKMLGGENLLLKDYEAQQWTEEKVLAALGHELNEAEWKMVRLMWERVNSMWPEIAATERELTGVVPERVDPRTVQTPFGPVEGGYWPAVYDSDPVRAAAAKVDLSTYQESDLERLFGQTGKGIGTNKGHTISRTDYVAPMLFNLEAVLFGHVQKVAKRVAYQGWATQALKVIRDPRIRSMWTRKLGKEYHAQLEPWLRDVINQGQVANTAHLSAITGFVKQARLNMTIMGLVGRISTMVAQVGGLTSSATAIGANNVLNGMRISASNYGENKARILDASDMMSRRVNEFDRDQAAALAELMKPPQTDLGRKLKPLANTRDKWNAFGFHMIGAIQMHLVDIPTWSGAYAQAVAAKAEGGLDMEHNEAVRYADRMVEEAQGSSRPAQLASIQRGGEWAKIVTLFYTFFGTQLNYQWQMAQDVRNNRYGKALKTGFWVTVATPLLGALMSDALSGDLPDDENEDTWLAWIMRNVFFGMFNGVPIGRDLANQASRKLAGKYAPDAQTPWQRVAGGVSGGLAEAFAAFSQTAAYREAEATMPFLPDPREVSDKWIRHTVEGFGYATGTGTGQVAATVQYGYDVATGAVHPEKTGDVIHGVVKGKQ